jgi:hypothetical protein
MANTVHGPYAPSTYTTTMTLGDAQNLETQAGVALFSLNPDLFTAFVLSGITCTKDGTTATQLDVASGYAYATQTDGTLARIDVVSDTFSTVGHATATMYLDLNPDGSWSWGTSHSAVSNHLTICSVTTDGSANISSVTDARTVTTTLLGGLSLGGLNVGTPGAAGSFAVNEALRFGGQNGAYIGSYADSAGGGGIYLYLQFSADKGFIFD